MISFLAFLAEPSVLWTLFLSSFVLVLLDYLLPFDWLAYVGYLCFSLCIGATISGSPAESFAAMMVVGGVMIAAHKLVFSRFLTNAPRYERRLENRPDLTAVDVGSDP